MTRDIAASVLARLKNHADRTKQPFDLTLTRYGLERLLYRLSISKHKSGFLLKGALLFTLWYDVPHRPTRDADLLGFGSDDIPTAEAIFRDVCATDVDDGVVFNPNSIRGSEIRKGAGYGGVRIQLEGKIKNVVLSMQVDIGFGDVVTPAPITVKYPVYLEEFPAPELRAYPKYTVVAEKFEAICKLGMTNSRMKDYFDLNYLLREGDLDRGKVRKAIEATFERRKTPLPAATPIGLSKEFINDRKVQQQWAAFLRKNRLENLSLADAISSIHKGIADAGLLMPPGTS
jgi:predicted nucleotidyltransferase component of viral defense system